MYKPNYEKNNIVNLMRTISNVVGTETPYNNHEIKDIDKYKNIILVVLDGLGYNYLMKYESFMKNNLHSKLEGAFPLTTAASNTVFSYGVPVQQHGLTGWFVFLKEIGSVTTVLPFMERYYGTDLASKGFNISDIIRVNPFLSSPKRNSYKILDKAYSHSAFSLSASKGASIIGVTNYTETFDKIMELAQSDDDKYIHAYIGNFDSSGHECGVESEATRNVFLDLDEKIKDLAESVTDSIILVTADHGMKDSTMDKAICLNDYPELYDCLSVPLSGDTRIAYCYIRNGLDKKFLSLVNKQLGDKVLVFNSGSMIKSNWYGLGKEHPMLKHRVGDYTLIAKDEYIIYDNLGNELKTPVIGHHSGISDDEVYVPLVVIRR